MDMERLREKYGIKSWATNSLDTYSFGRLLAKIGHGFAVAELGLGGFAPLLTDVILIDKRAEFIRYIGSYGAATPVNAEMAMSHSFKLSVEDAGGRSYITCELRLFEAFGAPGYRIVVGQPSEDFNPLRLPPASFPIADLETPMWRLILTTEPVEGEGWTSLSAAPVRFTEAASD
jgi:hypothetical protein